MGQLEGKTAVVTGGSDGIGLGAAVRLAQEGAHVFITGRREAELEKAAAVIGSATAVPGDVSQPADLDRLYDAVRARGKGLDVVFANAGTAGFARLEEMDVELLDRIYRVNILGTVFTVQKALPLLNEGASVILNSSTRADDGWEGFGAYGASKAALRLFGRTWANELKGRGIRVNTVSPGAISTPAVAKMVGRENAEAVEATFRAGVPLGRHGTVEEVAAAVAFLASPQSSFVLGANLYVDGGENGI
ncbi:SDR family oxidoreductase [Kineosporia sp. J2-2]|uniref:SDR family oxidoreductase n=1 Tax=Kineosporia corallincola TaxID=2835133 RepID=A0ABS5TCC8_9ACTN|nr:SDR family oxidoreductase [Kineosporia corallincola]MBT0768503.1 SDR family oxidoreductase [Kineosporia corallincola]